ncbi:serine/threonine protein kinase [Candidatus Venteria ishoeyi]|uniref:Serine/threonine-protein kinase D n=1 Tax=Candidatus Venteria ishoeyi TaxID=1899563 RepID=A0A1H6F415_9GAMM|nr:serine/threonine-protein kinase [Candidatus Venteria ishoeyi]SEH04887.1 Serine/threonine-protein kinase D [Candidatus Venteria ishoeyi]
MDISENKYRSALPGNWDLNSYKIKSVLGQGGFGITYLAEDINLQIDVAIKEYLPSDLATREKDYTVQPKTQQDDDDFSWGLERFIKEARILRQCTHPNVVRVLRFFNAHNTAYMVMEYEKGKGLDQLLSKGKILSEQEIMHFLPPLLESLKSVHNTGYLHRDIKPGNIYLRSTDHFPVLLDFGSARQDVSRRSQPMTSIVSEGYSPLEQYSSNSDEQGYWTDIYALGGVLYRAISGKIPVDAAKRSSAKVHGDPDPLISAVSIGKNRYSRQLLESIDWALELMEKDRPQNVQEWEDAVFTGKRKNNSKNSKSYRKKISLFLLLVLVIGLIGAVTAYVFL